MSTIHTKLKAGAPADVGISQESLSRAEAILESEIKNRRITAASLLVARSQTVVLSKGYGRLSPDADSPPVQPFPRNSLYNLRRQQNPFALVAEIGVGRVEQRGLGRTTDKLT